MKVVTVATMRQIEAAADAAGFTYDQMMQNAGRAVAERALGRLAGQSEARVTVLIGPGNNGGDGLIAGRIIAEESSAQVRFYLLKSRTVEDAHFEAVSQLGLFIARAEDDHDFRVLRNLVASSQVVIDALFGIGIRLPIKGLGEKVLRQVRQALHDEQRPENQARTIITPSVAASAGVRTRPYVIAVDCPSGLDCDSGQIDANAIAADETVTFIAAKPGLFLFPGAAAVGQLHIASIGIPQDRPELETEMGTVVDAQQAADLLPARPADANKGTFGKALIVAGSVNYVGAAGLSAMAAYRAGTGLVSVGAPQPVVNALCGHFLEPTWLLLPHDMGVLAETAAPIIQAEMGRYDALLLGPGWGRESTTRSLLLRLFEKQTAQAKPRSQPVMGFRSEGDQSPAVVSETTFPPLVIDADALNLLSDLAEWWSLLPNETIITPHPGEMARLAKVDTAEVQANRWQIASQKAAQWQVIVVLKGAHTLIAEPGGQVAVLPFKTDALATAGTGDVLAGTITGFLAQGLKPFDAAVVGAYLHGSAGQAAAQRFGGGRSVIAGDVLAALAEAIRLIETH